MVPTIYITQRDKQYEQDLHTAVHGWMGRQHHWTDKEKENDVMNDDKQI
jgi:hypothetical protein